MRIVNFISLPILLVISLVISESLSASRGGSQSWRDGRTSTTRAPGHPPSRSRDRFSAVDPEADSGYDGEPDETDDLLLRRFTPTMR